MRASRSPSLLLLLLVAILWALGGPARGGAQEAQDGTFQVEVQERVLDNGLTVLVWERPSAGRIGARVFYRVDIAAERPGTVGLTHMLEHYLFMGSPLVGTSDWEAERPYAEAVERLEREITDERNRNRDCFLQREVFAETEVDCRTPRLDSLQGALEEAFQLQHTFARGTDFDWIYQPAGGTGLTASTGRDWMKFDIDLPSSRLELFMWMERSRVEHPVFRYFEPEREVVVDQIRRADNLPEGPFLRVLRSMTYDAHPYGWAHWFSDLTRATREDHWEIFHKYFIPQNTILVVVGEVEAETVFRMAEAYWGSWQPGRPGPRLRTVEPEPVGEKRLTVEAPAGPAVVMHVPMPAVGHPDLPALELLAEILHGDRGLLAGEVVERRGVAVSASASPWVARYPSHFSLRVDARSNEELEAAEEGMEDVLRSIADGEVDPALLEAARDRMVLSLAGGLERIGPAAVRIGSMEATYRWSYLNEQPGLWSQVTVEDLSRVVDRYFGKEMRTVGHLRRTAAEPGMASSEKIAPPHLFESPAALEGASGSEIAAAVPPILPGGALEEWAFRDAGERNRPVGPTRGAQVRFRIPGSSPPHRSSAPALQQEDARLPKQGQTLPGEEDPLTVRAPLPVAEHPWYAPPWMAVQRPSAFAAPPPVEDWRALDLTPEPPALPRLEDHLRDVPGGLRAVAVSDPLLPLVRISALVDARTLDDPVGMEGMAELTAQVLRLGGTEGLAPAEVEARLNALGATLTHSVDHNRTRFHLLTPSANAVEAARLLTEILGRPALTEERVLEERGRRALEAERALDNAQTRVRALFHASLLGEDHPMGRTPGRATVEAISPEALRTFHARYYRPDRILFAVSGRMEEAAVLEALGDGWEPFAQGDPGAVRSPSDSQPASPTPRLGGDRAGTDPAGSSDPAGAAGREFVRYELPTRQGHVMFGHEGIQGFPEDHLGLEVLNYILVGGSFVSRYMELLRTETGITSAVYGSVEPGRDVSFPYVWRFSGNPETLAEGIRLAVSEMERIRREGVTAEELEGARSSYLQGLIPSAYETSHGAAERLAELALFDRYLYRSPGYLNYYAGDERQIEGLQRLTLEEVNAAARNYLHPDRLVIAVVGPLEEMTGLDEVEAELSR